MQLSGKKVLYVVTKSNWGGAQRYVYDVALAAHAAGADVAVVLGGTGEKNASAGLLAEKLREANIRTIFLKSFRRDIDAAREFNALRELIGVIYVERPNVVHLNSSKAGGLGALAGRLCRVPVIIFTAHGWAFREARSTPARMLMWIASWATCVLSHKVIVVSQRDKLDAPVFIAKRKIALIHNGIEARAPLTREEARKRLMVLGVTLPENIPVIATIGELTKNKAHDVLLDALARLTHPYNALIVGEGECRKDLERDAQNLNLVGHVTFAGFVPNASQLLPAADIFVLPSRKEGLPYVLLEAGLAGLPVVVSNTGGIPEVVENNVSGYLVPPENPPALAFALEEDLADPRRAERMAQALRATVITKFSREQMLERTFTQY